MTKSRATLVTIFLIGMIGCGEPDPELHSAVRAADSDRINELIAEGTSIDAKGQGGSTALMIAIEEGNKEIAEQLIALGADLNARENEGGVALHMAVGRQDPDLLSLLIDRGADPNISLRNYGSPLHLAAQMDIGSRIPEILIAGGADTNLISAENVTPVELAVGTENPALQSFIVEDTSASTLGRALLIAAGMGLTDAVVTLIDNGADSNYRHPEENLSALDAALVRDKDEVAKFLIDVGADVNGRFTNNATPLHIAASQGSTEMVAYLLDYGADSNLKNNDGETAADIAAARGYQAVEDQLRASM